MSNDIRDVKAPFELPSEWTWLWIMLGIVLAIAVAVLLFVWLKRHPSRQGKKEIPPVLAWDKAYQRLENLRLKKFIEQRFFKPFYIELSDIVRHYLEDRFNIRAPEMTTEEFLDYVKLQGLPVGAGHALPLLEDFLNISDMVKFAKHQPTALDAQKSFELAKQLIDQTRGI